MVKELVDNNFYGENNKNIINIIGDITDKIVELIIKNNESI
jgi:hypothetical protein